MARPPSFDYNQMLELHRKGMDSIRIGEKLGVDPSTIRKALAKRDLNHQRVASSDKPQSVTVKRTEAAMTKRVKEATENSVYAIQTSTEKVYATLASLAATLEPYIVRLTEEGEEPDLAVINTLRQVIDTTHKTIEMATHQLEIVYNAERVKKRDEVLMRILTSMGPAVVQRFKTEVNAIGAVNLVL